LTGFVKG
jgi:dTDP-4-amino-4,6-dideoxygalactose transaminase